MGINEDRKGISVWHGVNQCLTLLFHTASALSGAVEGTTPPGLVNSENKHSNASFFIQSVHDAKLKTSNRIHCKKINFTKSLFFFFFFL